MIRVAVICSLMSAIPFWSNNAEAQYYYPTHSYFQPTYYPTVISYGVAGHFGHMSTVSDVCVRIEDHCHAIPSACNLCPSSEGEPVQGRQTVENLATLLVELKRVLDGTGASNQQTDQLFRELLGSNADQIVARVGPTVDRNEIRNLFLEDGEVKALGNALQDLQE